MLLSVNRFSSVRIVIGMFFPTNVNVPMDVEGQKTHDVRRQSRTFDGLAGALDQRTILAALQC